MARDSESRSGGGESRGKTAFARAGKELKYDPYTGGVRTVLYPGTILELSLFYASCQLKSEGNCGTLTKLRERSLALFYGHRT